MSQLDTMLAQAKQVVSLLEQQKASLTGDADSKKEAKASTPDEKKASTWMGPGFCDSLVKGGSRAGKVCNHMALKDPRAGGKCLWHEIKSSVWMGAGYCNSLTKHGTREGLICNHRSLKEAKANGKCLYHYEK